METPAAGLRSASAKPFTHAKPTRTPVNEPGPEAVAKRSTSPSPTPFRAEQLAQPAVQDLRKTLVGMQGHLIQELVCTGQRDAAVVVRRVDGEDEKAHGFTSRALSTSYTLPLAFMP